MSKRTCSYHTADRSFHHPIFHLTFSKQCRIRHIKCIRARQGGFVTSAKSNAKALSTAVPSIKSTLAPCGVQDVRGTSVLHRPKRSEDLFFPAIGVLPTSHLQPFLVCHLYRSVPRPCINGIQRRITIESQPVFPACPDTPVELFPVLPLFEYSVAAKPSVRKNGNHLSG